MKPRAFQYHAPESVGEAVGLLEAHGDDAKVLAGGQSLVPMLNLRLTSFEHLVDLNRIAGLGTIERSSGTVRVGAVVRQAAAERSPDVAVGAPLLARALPHIGHFQIRNRGTVGGSIAHADPASELPAVALALDATLEVSGPAGVRIIAADEFFLSTWETAIGDGEILISVDFPSWGGRCGFAVEEIARRHGDFALAGAAVGVGLDEDLRVVRCAIGLFGVGSTPVRAHDAEVALTGGASIGEAAALAAADIDPPGDVHATAMYRKEVAAVVVRRALAAAIEEACL
ncbi:xanthine dehydrogenase family protein subunit M [Acidiferrimicrobium sp. IK]|uniref:FAD binding domain-containing protein n=1 Tax=Acidiferrimicrobium sp. IK TaxID=2871700 RepID=UPI0021CB4239|nr:xanthine dehydrogenase family protein subunit M [Acidiferrimicrobium sp. IK]MCU4184443.1 xanthine dehydrogenase family protein subunit M [Acidiferrimicrobium sp. IK]